MVANRINLNPQGLLNFLCPADLGQLKVFEDGLLNGFFPKWEGVALYKEGSSLYEKGGCWCFFIGHSRAIWPYLSQWKHLPFFLKQFLSCSV